MKNKLFVIVLFFLVSYVETSARLTMDSIQAMFPVGNFVSFRDNIACYRLKGIKKGGMYGFCVYDTTYRQDLTKKVTTWDKENGEVSKILNSGCYTVIAPVFDYALPFSEGWAPVCMNKKWSYVSQDGQFLCDFAFDAAYPFKGGKAKVVYDGKTYEINVYGDGLPDDVNKATIESYLELKANTFNQLYSESQYDKTIEGGRMIYDRFTTMQNGNLPELSASGLLSVIRIAFAVMSSQNKMMALSAQHFQNVFNKYRSLPISHFVSYESRHPEINLYNAEVYFSSFKTNFYHSCPDIILELDRGDYKSAILKFEKWLVSNNVSLSDNFSLRMLYYYLAELSDDFETANRTLIEISEEYESSAGDLKLDEAMLGIVLADIKKFKSAETCLLKCLEAAKEPNREIKLFGLNYNLALLYKSVNDHERSLVFFKKALEYSVPDDLTALRLECMSDFLNSQLSVNSLDETLLSDYVNSEINYNASLFETENSIILNRLWGNSILRMQRVTSFLDVCTLPSFLNAAFTLSVFMQDIVFDSDRYLKKIVRENGDVETQMKLWDFLEQKSKFKGIDVFDIISIEDSLRNEIYELYDKERDLKVKVRNFAKHFIPTEKYKNCNSSRLNLIDIVQYKDTVALYRCGAFVHDSNKSLTFIPLNIFDEFDHDNFWSKINLRGFFKPNDEVYIHYGLLDTIGLEFHEIDNKIPFSEYRLHRVSSLSNLQSGNIDTFNDNVVLYGGLYYGDTDIAQERGASKGYLVNSKIEIEEIATILKDRHEDLSIYEDDEGTIESVCRFSGDSPRILHFATHGYSVRPSHSFNPMEDRFNYYRQNTDIQQSEWLMNNTGLYLSLDADEENIMYANKIASLDLSKSELVVLSACATMSGNSSDGHMQSIGLTSALSLASAKNVISSLRAVEDEKSCEFMVEFYRLYDETHDIYDSFRRTVFLMRQKYPEDPHYWNSFVLVEN